MSIVSAIRFNPTIGAFAARLTAKGRELFPVIREMATWSIRHMPGAAKIPSGFLEAVEKKLAAHAPAAQ